MKFAKPRELKNNDCPDSCMTQPEMLRKLILEKIMPETGSSCAKYLDKSIEILKTEKRKKNRKIKINVADIAENLYFVICHVKGKRDNDKNGYDKNDKNGYWSDK